MKNIGLTTSQGGKTIHTVHGLPKKVSHDYKFVVMFNICGLAQPHSNIIDKYLVLGPHLVSAEGLLG